MEHPADLTDWLSGTGAASNPPAWTWRRTPAGVTVGPGAGKHVVVLFAMAFLGGVPVRNDDGHV